jgi:hypothetical protein
MEESKYYCRVCSAVIHPKRVAMGYNNTCVEHSETQKFTGLIVTEGKESEEISTIQVIRDPKLAEEIARLKASQSPDTY